ncbi:MULTISPECIES: hypothetical protein [Roseomonadaceae]|uniref:Uncharacterized protein n=1 Tax=Falsiroseomonas oleicola TaxID=2801474 RepID=A0ABS6H3X0_9PROT|nr:hypothetical protein [Roseomonas oleicola]MBU8543361.1 hypothetical protein [Roseomonas oleicola]
MRNLLHATDRDRLVAHLRGTMLRDVTVGARRLMALSDSEAAGFCAVPANAQVAELLAQPDIRDADPAFADGLLDFVMAMAETPLPCRRAALGATEVVRDDPRNFEIRTPFHRFTGDLSAGVVMQQMVDEAAAPVVHTGNLVEFRAGRFRNGIDAEDTITDFALDRKDGAIILRHESRITGKAGLLRPRTTDIGTLRYDYTITPGSPILQLSVTFTARRRIGKLRLSTALDQLGAGGLDMAEGRVTGTNAEWRDFAAPQAAGVSVWAERQPVAHLAMGVAGWPETGPTLHLRPGAPDKVMSVKAIAARPQALHWVILRHGPVTLSVGEALVVREERLLAPGLAAEKAASIMAAAGPAGAAMAGLELDPLPPNGAALNAVATQLLFAARGAYRTALPAMRVAALQAWFDRQMAALQAGEPALPDLAGAILAAEARRRAGAEVPLDALVRRLIGLQQPSGTFEDRPGLPASLVGQALALLAMARALPHLDPPLLADPIGRALAAVQPGLTELQDGGRLMRLEGLVLEGGAAYPLRSHAEALGLMARAATAVALVAELRPEALPLAAVNQAQALHRKAVALLRPLVRPQGQALVVQPSPLGGAPNAAGQAALVLGLTLPDAAMLQQPVAA